MLTLTPRSVSRYLRSRRSPVACNRAMERLLKTSRLTPWTDYAARLLVLREAVNERRHVLVYQAYGEPALVAPHLTRMVDLAQTVWRS